MKNFTCGRFLAVSSLCTLLLAFAHSALAETYYWNQAGDGSTYYKWSDPANWLVGASKEQATQAPGLNDTIDRNGDPMAMYFDANGGTVTCGEFLTYVNGKGDAIGFQNGIFDFGKTEFASKTVIDISNATLTFDGDVAFCGDAKTGSKSSGSPVTVNVNEGGELCVNSGFYPKRVTFNINEGGKFTYSSTAGAYNCNANVDWPVNNRGTMYWPEGFHNYKGDAWSFKPLINQISGEWQLGGIVKYNQNIFWRVTLTGGTVKALENKTVSFNPVNPSRADLWYLKFADGADIALEAAAGATLDLSNFSYEGAAKVTLQGAGTIKLPTVGAPTGITVKDAWSYDVSAEGAEMSVVAVEGRNASVTISGSNVSVAELGSVAGTLRIDGAGLAITALAEGAMITGAVEVGEKFKVGDTVVTSADAAVLRAIANNLTARGVSTAIEGSALKLAASDYTFNSTSVTDFSNPSGWKSGSVPPAGLAVSVSGEGVLAEISSAINAYSEITVSDGATLKVSLKNLALPKIKLVDGGTLEVAADIPMPADISAALPEDPATDDLGRLVIDEGATLSVPGGTSFSNVDMLVKGAVVLTSAGDVVFGSAAAGKTTWFGLTFDGGSVTTLGAGNVNFFCPEAGGTVKAKGTVLLKDAAFGTNHGFNFGVNNKVDEIVAVTLDGTTLDFAKNWNYISGTTRISLVNGAAIAKSTGVNEKTSLWITDYSTITLDATSTFIYGESQTSANSVGGAAIGFRPTDDGFVQLTVNGGMFGFHRTKQMTSGMTYGGNGKAVFKVNGGKFVTQYGTWSRGQPFESIKRVDVGDDGLVIARGSGDNLSDNATCEISAPIGGTGDVTVQTDKPAARVIFKLSNAGNTCTGALKVADPATAKLQIAATAVWPGSIEWNGGEEIVHADTADVRAFGGIILKSNYNFRMWQGANDVINLEGAGWTQDGGEFAFNFVDGYAPSAGDVWRLGTIPASSTVPTLSNANYALSAEPVEGDETKLMLVLEKKATDFSFDASKGLPITDPNGWACGYVPEGQDVKIANGTVVINADTPSFSSISVAAGSGVQAEGTVSIPSMTLKGDAALTIVGGAEGDVATLAGTLSFLPEEDGDLPQVTVEAGAVFAVPGGTAFGNVALTVYGALATAGTGDLRIGSAAAEEVTRTAVTVDGGSVTTADGDLLFFCPLQGGTAKAEGDVLIRDATLAHDLNHGVSFGYLNPEDETVNVIFDGSANNVGFKGTHYVAGGCVLTFRNGARFTKGTELDDWSARSTGQTAFYVRDAAKIVMEDGTDFRYGVGAEQSGWNHGYAMIYFNPTEDGAVPLEVKGATFEAHRVNGNGKAVLSVADATNVTTFCTWNKGSFFAGFKGVEIAEGFLTLLFPANLTLAESGYNSETFAIPFSGNGGLIVRNDHSAAKTVTIKSAENTALGLLAAEGSGPVGIVLASGSNWAGPVRYDERVSFSQDDATTPTQISVGGLELERDLTFRVWPDKNDVVNIGAFGLAANGHEFKVQVMDPGYNPEPGTEFTLGTVSADLELPENSNVKWEFVKKDIQGYDDLKALVVRVASVDFTFNSDKVTDLNDPAGWACGYVPAGQDVTIAGAGVNASVTNVATPVFASISIQDGASLTVATNYAAEVVTVGGEASFAVAAGGDMAVGRLATRAIGDAIPTVAVAAGGRLVVPGGTTFKDVAMDLRGELATSSDGMLTFGYAEEGETTRFAFTSDGARILATGGQGKGNVRFVCAEAGGEVLVEGDIVIKGVDFGHTMSAAAHIDGFVFGSGNPSDKPFNVKVVDTKIDCLKNSSFNGGCVATFSGSSMLSYDYSWSANDGKGVVISVLNRAKLVFEAGTTLLAYITGNWSGTYLDLSPDEEGWESLTVKDGARVYLSHQKGNGKAKVVVADAIWELFYNNWWDGGRMQYAFDGAQEVFIPEGKSLFISRNGRGGTDQGTWTGDCPLSTTPFSGAGDLVVSTNFNGGSMTVDVESGANTCTGRAFVDPAAVNNRLRFADGANWAGTVVWDGRVSLGVTDGVPATFTFGAVDLRTDFPIRVWTDAQGNVTSDRINITGAGFTGNGGKVVIDFQGGVEPPEGYQFYPLGTMPKDAALPTVRSATWCVKARKIKGDDERLEYGLVRNRGFIISIY